VRSVDGVMAVVDVPVKSACEGCTAGICKPQDKFMEIEAFNQAGAAVGQRVRVAVSASSYMKNSMIVYGLPAVGLVLGAIFGKEVLSRFLPGTDPDILSATAGFTTLFISFIIVKVWTDRKAGKIESRPVIEEILR
jgi:sigma-E factor negative regulatory protein RseC